MRIAITPQTVLGGKQGKMPATDRFLHVRFIV